MLGIGKSQSETVYDYFKVQTGFWLHGSESQFLRKSSNLRSHFQKLDDKSTFPNELPWKLRKIMNAVSVAQHPAQSKCWISAGQHY